MVLAIFGNVNEKDVLEKIKRHFAKLKPKDSSQIAPAQEPKTKAVRTSSKTLPKQQSLVLLGFYGSTVFNEDRFVIEVICQILSQASGRLFTQIREKAGLAYTLGAYSALGLEPGYIVIYVATISEAVETVKKEILHQLSLLKEELLSEEELAQAKKALVSRKLIGRQTNSACALESSLDELYGLGFDYYLGYTERINRIETGDIKRCANKYFDLANYAVVVVGPNNQEEK